MVHSSQNALIFWCILTVSVSCKHSQTSEVKQVIGNDDRVTMNSKAFDDRIGALIGPTTKCNASLVAENTVVTALHCVPKGREKNFTFFSADNSFSSKVSAIKKKYVNVDLLFLNLENKSPQFFEIYKSDTIATATIFAYDTEKGIVTDLTDCTKNSAGKIFQHTCDTVPGYSGAPFIIDGKIVGVHLGHDYTSRKNIGVSLEGRDSSSLEYNAFAPEVACGEDCYKHCRRKVVGNWIPNPPCEAACVVERQTDCWGHKDVEVCGVKFTVPAISYLACQGAIAAMPAACTVGTATSAGVACALDIGAATAVCGISAAVTTKIAAACASGN